MASVFRVGHGVRLWGGPAVIDQRALDIAVRRFPTFLRDGRKHLTAVSSGRARITDLVFSLIIAEYHRVVLELAR